ncbi:MAG: DUF4912 domain-containing protein [Cyanobacteria bacterium P01_G01_bin.19]
MAKERPPLEEMTLRQLRKVASEYKISRYSRMRKAQLLASIREAIRQTEEERFSQNSSAIQEEQQVKAKKFEVGQEDNLRETLASVDRDLGELPDGYGESRIVLMPRDPQWAYAYWDVPGAHKEELRRQGGQQLALRIYDTTDIDINHQAPHSVQEYLCDEMAREWYLPIPVSDRDYVADIGYRCADGRWLVLARSASVSIPPVYPSDWIEDAFITVNWEDDLRGKTLYTLVPPAKKQAMGADAAQGNDLYNAVFGMTKSTESMRMAGSLFGSMQQTPEAAVSSYIFPSGVGMWAVPSASGQNMSGAGFSGDVAPVKPRKFWLVADAELIVYGATEPDATVTIGDRKIELNPDGTFRFQMSFQDGVIDYPIKAVAVDGEQTRSIHMNFERETPSRNTNTKAEAVEEWFV